MLFFTPLRAMCEVEQAQFDSLCRIRQIYEDPTTTRPDAELFLTAIVLLQITLQDAGVLARL